MKSYHVYHCYKRLYSGDDYYEQKIIEDVLQEFTNTMKDKDFKIININQNFNSENYLDLYIFYEVC